MGWIGGDDTLAQVELSFPSMESAVAFARRNGLTYTVIGHAGRNYQGPRMVARATDADREQALARRRRIQWVEDMLRTKTYPRRIWYWRTTGGPLRGSQTDLAR
jgi:hypothetical protein